MWIVKLNYQESLIVGEEGEREVLNEFSTLFGPFKNDTFAHGWAKAYSDKVGLVGYDVWFVNKL